MTGYTNSPRVLWYETAWGKGCLVYTPRPFAVCRITLPGVSPDPLPESDTGQKSHPSAALRVQTVLTAYFNGQSVETIPKTWLYRAQITPREQAVLEVVRRIPYGKTRAYGEVAKMAGFPRGARFAGNALHKNPFPVIIPCHRVIRADGSLGGFGSGCEMKRKMIALEAKMLQKRSRV